MSPCVPLVEDNRIVGHRPQGLGDTKGGDGMSRTWAPTHSRLTLEWLARVEDARERARFDVDEDARELLIEKLRGEAREEGNEE